MASRREDWTLFCSISDGTIATIPEFCTGRSLQMPNRPMDNATCAQYPSKGLTPMLDRNIESLRQRRRREERAASWQERLADAITRFCGSLPFVYVHAGVFGFWIAANLHWIPGIPVWDESFVVLAMVASVEAIFLSTFVLITQNR